MRKLLMICAVALVAAAFALPAWAGAQDPFSESEMLKCIADAPEFIKFMQSQGEMVESAGEESNYEALVARKAAVDYLEDKGWNPERFSYVFTNISEGYAAVKMKPQMAALKAQQAQLEKMADMPGMTPEMMAEMKASMMDAENIGKDVPASEMSLIEANMPAIENMIHSMR